MTMIELVLKTEEAQFHFRGRGSGDDSPPIFGLLTFARIAATIKNDAEQGSEQAKRKLGLVANKIEHVNKQLCEAREEMEHLLASSRNLVFQLTGKENVEPKNSELCVPLKFSCY